MDRVTAASDDSAVSAAARRRSQRQYALPPEAAPRLRRAAATRRRQSHHSLTAVRDPSRRRRGAHRGLAGRPGRSRRSGRAGVDRRPRRRAPGSRASSWRSRAREARVVLVESVGKKAGFLEEAVEQLRLENVEVVERPGRGVGRRAVGQCDVVTARALARLDILLEYAAPLLRDRRRAGRVEGQARQGRRRPAPWAAGKILGMEAPVPTPVAGPDGAERHLYLSRKLRPTPPGYPRRPGMAAKRPLGGSSRA